MFKSLRWSTSKALDDFPDVYPGATRLKPSRPLADAISMEIRFSSASFFQAHIPHARPNASHDPAFESVTHPFPLGTLGRPKSSSRSRIILRAFLLRKYGNGALASINPKAGST